MGIIGTLPAILQNGTTADASQVMADLNYIVNQVNANAMAAGTISPGSLVGIQVLTASGTYTPTAGATKAIVEAVGGGGAGGGASSTNSGQWAFGAGGSSGAYGKIFIASGLVTQNVTIGVGGTGTVNGTGGNGGQTSFGSGAGALLVCPGGPGGAPGAAVSAAATSVFAPQTSGAAAPSGTGRFLFSTSGGNGAAAFSLPSYAIGGDGGSNPIGQGGSAFNVSAATGYGAGGAGANNGISQSAKAGLNGSAGVVIVYEFE
ncbi:hypothetical protein [Burkholderia multivorans]|uniref:glycine-rich domain-containing protein n=1 Tax=Burkholderia multivorans TaxID=87883 RepID=UPI0004F7130A|nr:hypothetical protein [Burkholderia multivorans]AIO75453.1 hypothetical protein DM80_3076 [Burkholderia multivorans]